MSGFVKAYSAAVPRTKESGQVSLFYAGILTVMSVAQLFTFEDFLVLFNDMFGVNGSILAALIVVIEVFALPFLLRVPLSKAFRWLSLGFSGLTALIWLVVTSWTAFTKPAVTSTGLLGTLDPLGPGVWAVALSFALGMLATWSIWGLWPLRHKK